MDIPREERKKYEEEIFNIFFSKYINNKKSKPSSKKKTYIFDNYRKKIASACHRLDCNLGMVLFL